MKTSKVISFLIVLFIQLEVIAQDTIYVSYDKVTAIQFPSNIVSPVITGKYLVAHVQDDNLLSLKATGKDFNESSLVVTTVDGTSYKFPVSFSYGRAGRINRLRALKVKESQITETPSLNFIISRKIAESRKSRTVSRDKSGKVKSEVGNIAVSGDNLYYRLRIKNRSNISFDIDFIRFYLRDTRTTRRTVIQEQEIYPVYTYGTEHETVAGDNSEVYVFALNKFPLAKDKALFIEIYEKNGGRHQYLTVKQSDIERANLVNLK